MRIIMSARVRVHAQCVMASVRACVRVRIMCVCANSSTAQGIDFEGFRTFKRLLVRHLKPILKLRSRWRTREYPSTLRVPVTQATPLEPLVRPSEYRLFVPLRVPLRSTPPSTRAHVNTCAAFDVSMSTICSACGTNKQTQREAAGFREAWERRGRGGLGPEKRLRVAGGLTGEQGVLTRVL